MNLRPFLILFPLVFSLFGAYAGINSKDSLVAKLPRIYNTTRLTTSKPTIDGVLNDPCWNTGEWSGDFTQWIPKEGALPTEKTQVKILYDDKNLYVALRAFDHEPSRISRKAGRRDEMTGDIMGVNFDSYHDHRTGFEFSVTAAGQKVDLILTNPMNGDFNWNAVWYVKTGLEDSAWVAEYEIPLSQLRYSKADEQVWGLHAWRWIDRVQEESDWEPQSSTGPGMLYAFGELRGLKGIPKSQRIEIMPYAVGKL
ncbi:MAG TPA: hydrolase, partial [Prolixibacteraceae bacterium]|nr:hydrolase [Prolixibacteraceae bacterium]